jgi:hypothetical protein
MSKNLTLFKIELRKNFSAKKNKFNAKLYRDIVEVSKNQSCWINLLSSEAPSAT